MSGKFIVQPNASVSTSVDSGTPENFTQRSYLGSLLGLFLLSLVYAFPAHGQCVHWYYTPGERFNNGLGAPSNLRIFSGSVGEQQIRMSLHYDVATRTIEGFYGYSDQPGTLTLHGEMLPSRNGMNLVERDAQGKVTGHFSLVFTYPSGPNYDAASVKKHISDYDCSYVKGSWHPASDNRSLQVELWSSGEQTQADQQARKLNDEAAYKVQMALLNNNKKSFASLLKYPFCTSRFGRGRTLWKSPEDVIAHYKQISRLAAPAYLHEGVPHAIDTHGKISDWMGDTMEFEDGKVKSMCDGSCFHSDCYLY